MADITTLQLVTTQASNVSITTDTTVLTQSSGTINLASLSLSNTAPSAVARTASAGASNLASRSDHVHSAANLLVDGGSY
ncbi:hypothetical protein EB001_10645 [bacterium]|nr:hypothetical protein [bacterium]